MSWCLILLLAFSLNAFASAADKVFMDGGVPEELWNKGEFTEGVAVRFDGLVFFSDIHLDVTKPGQVLVFDPSTNTTRVYCDRSSKSNGLAFDSSHRLIACCGANGGNRALCEIKENGSVHVLADTFDGQSLNAPNDLVIHPNGSIYFSDPRYLGPEPLKQQAMYLFRFDPTTSAITIASRAAKKPNGVEVSPDGRTLYVAETDNGVSGVPGDKAGPRGMMQLLAFDVADDGSLGNARVLVDFGKENGIDGMAVDQTGRIFAAVRSENHFGIAVYDSGGKQLDFLKTPVLPTNCDFGIGDDSKTLYITAGRGLYRVKIAG